MTKAEVMLSLVKPISKKKVYIQKLLIEEMRPLRGEIKQILMTTRKCQIRVKI